MPSPFPGMDPYLESPELWSDFHNNLASRIQAQLNPLIQPNYFARTTPHVTYDVIEVSAKQPYGKPLDSKTKGIYPDVSVWQRGDTQNSVTAIAIPPAPVESRVKLEVPLRFYNVEIRHTENKSLITVIEILSPVNKRPSHESYASYQRKRRDLLRSSTHLLEIDLLRGGTRPPLETKIPQAPYYVVLSRATDRPRVAVWPIQLQDELPLLPVPLFEPDPDVPLDLKQAVATIYEESAYALEIDYQQPPPPPTFAEEEANWLRERLNQYTTTMF